MPINPQIYVPQIQPMQLQDPMVFARNALAMDEAEASIAANQLKVKRANQLAGLIKGGTKPLTPQDLLSAGLFEEAESLAKAENALTAGQKSSLDVVGAAMDTSARLLDTVRTPQEMMAWHEANHADPVLGKYLAARGITAEQSRAKIAEAAKDPEAFGQLVLDARLGLEKSRKNHFVEQNYGGGTRVLAMGEYGGPAREVAGSDIKVTASPNRPVSNIQNFLPASETAQTEFIKEFRDTYKQLKTAPVDIANLRRAAELAQTEGRKYMGTGGQAFLSAAKFLKNRLGVDIDAKALADAEEARTVLFQNVLGNLRKLDAQPSQQQQFIMQEALGNLDTDPDALPRVVQVYEDVIRGRVDQHNREFAEMKANPNLANAFPYSLEIKLPPAVTVTGPGGRPLGATADQPIKVKTPAELNALPPGSLYIGPDGKTRRKPNG